MQGYGNLNDRKIIDTFEYEWYNPSGERINRDSQEEKTINLNKKSDFGLYKVKVKGRTSNYESEVYFQIIEEPSYSNYTSDPFKVSIWYSPQPPVIDEEFKIYCNVTNNPMDYIDASKIDLYKSDAPANSQYSESYYDPTMAARVLKIYKFNRAAAGEYRCVFLMNNGSYTQKINIEWHEPPPSTNYHVSIDYFPKDYQIGSFLELTCGIKPSPAPANAEFRWYSNGKEIASGPVYRIPSFSNKD
ncbi:hypothetical protein Ciccas_014614, partial [Cichlidogyrus casuarinus]